MKATLTLAVLGCLLCILPNALADSSLQANIQSMDYNTSILLYYGSTGFILTSFYTEYEIDNMWRRFTVTKTTSGHYTFDIGKNAYISAGNDNDDVTVENCAGPRSLFTLEVEGDHFYIKSWRNTYLKANPGNESKIVQTATKDSSCRWYFVTTQDPTKLCASFLDVKQNLLLRRQSALTSIHPPMRDEPIIMRDEQEPLRDEPIIMRDEQPPM